MIRNEMITVNSWCEVVIRSFATSFEQDCSICLGGDDKDNIYRFCKNYVHPLNVGHPDPLTVAVDDNGDFYVRSQPLPVRERLLNCQDNCCRFADNVVTLLDQPVEYTMFVEYNDEDIDIIEEMKERESECRFKISEQDNVQLDVIEISGKRYLRLWIHLTWAPLIYKIFGTFHKILPKRWFE